MTFVATTSPSFARRGTIVPARLKATGWRFERYDDLSLPNGGMGTVLAEIDYLVVGLHPVTNKVLDAAPRLKGVLKHGAGIDNIDVAACTARGIPVTNAPGANANSVAELAIASMFSVLRRLPTHHGELLAGRWLRVTGNEVAGRTFGVIGFGNIGRLAAQKASALGMKVVVAARSPERYTTDYPDYRFTSVDDLLAQADVVSLHLSGGPANAGLIDASAIAAMKPGAVLLNFSRGDVLDDAALARALEDGHLGGAALDVHLTEPPDLSRRIYSAPNTLFTPHVGMETEEAITNVGCMVMDDIEAMIEGSRPAHCVNPKVLTRTIQDQGRSTR